MPRNPSNVGGLSLGSTQDVLNEMMWAIGILSAEQKILKGYISQKALLDSLMADGDYEAASVCLDNVVKLTGWSHLALGMKCYLIGQTEGLEAQKSWIASQVFERTSAPVVFFAYWVGVRTEPAGEPLVFERSIKQYIDSTMDEEERVFLLHIMLGEPAPAASEALLLRQLQNQSVVDLYEGLVSQSIAAASDFRDSSQHFYEAFLPFMSEIGDQRAVSIAAAMGDERAFASLRSTLSEWTPSQELNFARTLALKPISKGPKAFKKLVHSFCNDALNDRELRSSLGMTAYSAVWSTFSQYAATAYRLKSTTSLEEAIFQYRIRFVHDGGLDPFLCGLLHPAIVAEHVDEAQFESNCRHVELFELGRALAAQDHSSIQGSCRNLTRSIGREDPELLRLEVISHIEEGSLLPLIKRLHPLISTSPELIQWLPYSKIADAMTDDVIRQLGQHPETAVLLAHVVPFTGEQIRSQLIFAIEHFLSSMGCDRASELDPEFVRSNPAVKELILLGCKMDTLALSLCYEDGDEMQSERISELQLLASVDDELAAQCSEEIEEIVRSQEIANAIDKLKTGKINCDENQIQAWARESLSGKFDRFRAFVDAGILPTTPGLAKELLVAIREGSASTLIFEVPKNEAASIAQELVGDLIAAYSFDPVFGLNSYLSLRVRHGTVSGQIRRSWTEERLLTTADSDGDRYEVNEHWFEILRESLPIDQAALIGRLLGDFSRDLDQAITGLTDEKIQILSKAKPDGIIATGLADIVKMSFYDDASSLETFDEFLAGFSSLFWSNLDTTLDGTRKYLGQEFRSELEVMFDQLDQEISRITSMARVPPLSDAITRARLTTNQSVDEMLDWFRGSRPVDTDPFPVQDLASISLEIVKRLNPEFDPILVVTGDTDFVAVSALFLFTDVFFVLFDNAQKHSGFRRPSISIDVEVTAQKLLRVVFSSDCSDIETAGKEATKANTMISNREYTSGLAAEGGTGLAKIAKIVENSKSQVPLQVSVTEQPNKFVVAMEFSYVDLGETKSMGELE